MYVYQKSEEALWSVGIFTSDGRWVSESDWESPQLAAIRCNWLNGGSGHTPLQKAALMITQGMVNSDAHVLRAAGIGYVSSLEGYCVRTAKAVLEEANK